MKSLLFLCALLLCGLKQVLAGEAHLIPPSVRASQSFVLNYQGGGSVDFNKVFSSANFKASKKSQSIVIASRLRCRLETVAVGSGTFACRVLSPTLRTSVGRQARPVAKDHACEKALDHDWFFITHSQGAVRGFIFARHSLGEERDLLRSLIPLFQFVRAGRKNEIWTVRLSGQPLSIERPVAWRFVRSKQGVRASLQEVLISASLKTRAWGTMQFEPAHITTRVHVVASVGNLRAAQNDVAATLVLKNRSVATNTLLNRLRVLEKFYRTRGVRLSLGQEDTATIALQEQQLLAQNPHWQPIFARACGSNPGNAFSLLRLLLCRRPQLCGVITRSVTAKGTPRRSLNVLLQILPGIGNGPAQEALLLLAQKSQSSNRDSVFVSLGGLQNPSQNTVAFLMRWSATSSSAALSLGACIRSLHLTGQHNQACTATHFLVGSLKKARSKEQLVASLLALGNAGQSEARPSITRYLSSSDPDVRAVACHALRYDKSVEAEMSLCARLQKDASAPVRMEALRSLAIQRRSRMRQRAVASQLKRETNPDIRAALKAPK